MKLFANIIKMVLSGEIHDHEPPKDYEFHYEGAVGFDQLSDYLYHEGYGRESDDMAQCFVEGLMALGFSRVNDDFDDDYYVL